MTGEQVRIELDPNVDETARKLADNSSRALEVAEAIARQARSIAPVDTGRYANSITAARSKRGAVVMSKVPYAHIVEFGAPGSGQPANWVFHRAAKALGFKFKKRS